MEVLINGQVIKEYFSNNKVFVEGRNGSSFSIRLRNNSSEQVLFVPTVDGLSVMDGKEGSFDSRGYIVNAYSLVTIDGWRLNEEEVAMFYFSSPEDSYRKRKRMGNNIGSIAVAVFREKEKKVMNYPYFSLPYQDFSDYTSLSFPKEKNAINKAFGQQTLFDSNSKTYDVSASNTCSSFFSNQESVSQEIGTGFGGTKMSRVLTISFDKENMPDAILEVFYNSRKQLEKLGINFNKPIVFISEPNSFPNEKGYCERPRR